MLNMFAHSCIPFPLKTTQLSAKCFRKCVHGAKPVCCSRHEIKKSKSMDHQGPLYLPICCYAVLFTHDIQYETGVLFHEKLRRAGVPTSLFIAPGQPTFAKVSFPVTCKQLIVLPRNNPRQGRFDTPGAWSQGPKQYKTHNCVFRFSLQECMPSSGPTLGAHSGSVQSNGQFSVFWPTCAVDLRFSNPQISCLLRPTMIWLLRKSHRHACTRGGNVHDFCF